MNRGERYDLVVLGGGVMGLSCAFAEAKRGRNVAVIDPNTLGNKASWAAAGILAARAGVVGQSPFRNFYLRSLSAYPAWLANISATANMPIPYQRSGDYQIFPLDDAESLRAVQARENQLQREKAVAFSVSEELPDFLRGYSSLGAVRVFHFPEDGFVNNRALLLALEQGLRNLGATLFPQHRPRAITVDADITLAGTDWELHSQQLLIAAGAWCNEVLQPLRWSAPMTPVKGQLALLPNFHGYSSMAHFLERFYLVPRDGHLIAGSTTEPGVWNENFDSVGETHLRGQLHRYFPQVEPAWVETWSGIRPRTRDRLPLMGWIDDQHRIALCTGHYKSGISLAPLSAQCLSALLQDEKPPADLEPFSPRRPGGLTPHR